MADLGNSSPPRARHPPPSHLCELGHSRSPYAWPHMHLSFCVWLVSWSTGPPRPTHAVAGQGLRARQGRGMPHVQTYHTSCVHLSAGGRLACFHVWAVVNNFTLLRTWVCKSPRSVLFGTHPEVELLGHLVALCLTRRSLHTVSVTATLISIPTAVHRVPAAPCPRQ